MAALPQYMEALAHGNKIRLGRAVLKRQIARGETTAAAVILDTPDEALTMAILDLLMSQHRWGRARSLRLLQVAALKEGKRLGELTPRQRGVLVNLLDRCWE